MCSFSGFPVPSVGWCGPGELPVVVSAGLNLVQGTKFSAVWSWCGAGPSQRPPCFIPRFVAVCPYPKVDRSLMSSTLVCLKKRVSRNWASFWVSALCSPADVPGDAGVSVRPEPACDNAELCPWRGVCASSSHLHAQADTDFSRAGKLKLASH